MSIYGYNGWLGIIISIKNKYRLINGLNGTGYYRFYALNVKIVPKLLYFYLTFYFI